MNAPDILSLLKSKHHHDIFVSECKDGPTHYGRHSRLDAWVMKKSWINPLYIGYEIKINRSDFINDDKWHNYLPMCNELYFVSPSNIIKPEEIPEQTGLLWVSKTSARLYKKKKAPHREIEPPWLVMAYVLMQYGPTGYCNFKKLREYEEKGNNVKDWKEWLKHKKINRKLGRMVSGMIAKKLIENQAELDDKIEDLKAENERLCKYKELIELSGFRWQGREGKLKELQKLNKTIEQLSNGKMVERIKFIRDELDNTIKTIEANA